MLCRGQRLESDLVMESLPGHKSGETHSSLISWELDSAVCTGHEAMAVRIVWYLAPSLGHTCPGGSSHLFSLSLGFGTGLGPSRHAVHFIVPVAEEQ